MHKRMSVQWRGIMPSRSTTNLRSSLLITRNCFNLSRSYLVIQKQGATCAMHLNNLEVASAVHSWVTGLVPVDKGGFEGHVSVVLAYLSLITQLILSLSRCFHANYANMSINFSSLNYRLRTQSVRLLLSTG